MEPFERLTSVPSANMHRQQGGSLAWKGRTTSQQQQQPSSLHRWYPTNCREGKYGEGRATKGGKR